MPSKKKGKAGGRGGTTKKHKKEGSERAVALDRLGANSSDSDSDAFSEISRGSSADLDLKELGENDPTLGFHNKLVDLRDIDAQRVMGVFSEGKGKDKDKNVIFGEQLPGRKPQGSGSSEAVANELEKRFATRGRSKVLRGIGMAALGLTGVGALWELATLKLVKRGEVMITMNRGRPEIYGPGFNCLLSPYNKEVARFKVNDLNLNISAGPLNIITIPANSWGLAQVAGSPELLLPGIHVIDDQYFQYSKTIRQDSKDFNYLNMTRVIIWEGKRGLALAGNRPMILKPGIYQSMSPLFSFKDVKRLDQQVVDLNPFTIVTVRDGEVGVSYQRGQLVVLAPGEHWLNMENNERFEDFLTTQEQVRPLKIVEVLTNDGLIVRLQASISFRILNPESALVIVGRTEGGSTDKEKKKRSHNISEQIFETVMARADNTFAGLLTGSDLLSSMALGLNKGAAGEADDPAPTSVGDTQARHEGELFDSKEHSRRELNKIISHQFLRSLTKTLRHEWGVALNDMSVVEIEIMDKNVRKALADGIRGNIEAATQRRNAEAMAETNRILAGGERDAQKIRADGEAYEIKAKATAQKEAGDMLAETPVAVDIRLAEAAASAVAKGQGLVVIPDASSRSLLSLIGASSRVMSKEKARNASKIFASLAAKNGSDSRSASAALSGDGDDSASSSDDSGVEELREALKNQKRS